MLCSSLDMSSAACLVPCSTPFKWSLGAYPAVLAQNATCELLPHLIGAQMKKMQPRFSTQRFISASALQYSAVPGYNKAWVSSFAFLHTEILLTYLISTILSSPLPVLPVTSVKPGKHAAGAVMVRKRSYSFHDFHTTCIRLNHMHMKRFALNIARSPRERQDDGYHHQETTFWVAILLYRWIVIKIVVFQYISQLFSITIRTSNLHRWRGYWITLSVAKLYTIHGYTVSSSGVAFWKKSPICFIELDVLCPDCMHNPLSSAHFKIDWQFVVRDIILQRVLSLFQPSHVQICFTRS